MKNVLIQLLPKSLVRKILLYKHGFRVLTAEDSFLAKQGYTKSLMQKKPVKNNGEYIPWMNYPIVGFLEERLTKNMRVFEYGSGYSTIFYSTKVKEVVSVEYDKVWFDHLTNIFLKRGLDNVELIFQELNEDYPKRILDFNGTFDIVIVDGRERVKCIENLLSKLTDAGIILLDDSSRDRYAFAFDFLKAKGFKQITFSGIKPGEYQSFSTTLFYRDQNCFMI